MLFIMINLKRYTNNAAKIRIISETEKKMAGNLCGFLPSSV